MILCFCLGIPAAVRQISSYYFVENQHYVIDGNNRDTMQTPGQVKFLNQHHGSVRGVAFHPSVCMHNSMYQCLEMLHTIIPSQ